MTDRLDVFPPGKDGRRQVSALPGFFLSTGYSGNGFGIGPGGWRLAAELIAGDASCVDPTPFRYERLVDGGTLQPAGMM